MMTNKRKHWRRILSVAYSKPVAPRWRRVDVPVFPGWLFDALVVASCVLLASSYFFGLAGVIGAVCISPLPLFLMKDLKKRSATKAEENAARKEPAAAAPESAPAAQDVSRRPVKTIRLEDCSASIWARQFSVQGTPTTFYSVSFERSYKARDGWKYTKSFDADSLGKVASLCQQASEAIQQLQQDAE